ncbi:MAG: MFS transporter [Pirellulales bacterium]
MNQSQPNSAMRTAWLMVMLLWPVALLNYLDRQMLATMKTSMVGDIADIASEANWGIVLGAFKWTYALLSPIGGYIADRFSRRLVITMSLFIWSAVTLGTGHVDTYYELVWARALMGVSEAFYYPAALALITDFHVGSTRSRAVGVHQTAIYVGAMMGVGAGYAADTPDFGWRLVFYLCGAIGMIYAIPLFLLLRNPARALDRPLNPPPLAAAGELLKNGAFLLLLLYFTLPSLAGWVVRDWMPPILKDRFDLTQGNAGLAAVIPWQLAALIGVVVGGWLADRWMQRNVRGRIYVSAIGMSLFLPALFGVGNSQTVLAAVLFLALFGFGWGFFDCNNMPILCQIARPELRATGYGLMNLVGISIGGFADWIFGSLQDRGVPLNVIFGVFAGIALLSVIVVLLIRPKAADVR